MKNLNFWMTNLKTIDGGINQGSMRMVAKALALRQIDDWTKLSIVKVVEVPLWVTSPVERALLTAAVKAAVLREKADYAQACADALVPLCVPGVKRPRLNLDEFR